MKTILDTITDELTMGGDKRVDSEVVRAAPTPGSYYRIKRGDILLRIAALAYPGEKRYQGARRINSHPRNRKYFRRAEKDNLFPQGKVSFLPRFGCDISEQIRAKTEAPGGRCYAVLWIPKKEPGPFDEHNTCGVPQRSVLDEIALEGEIEDFEKAKKKRKRARVRPRLSFFQNVSGSSERNHFQCGALRQSRQMGAIGAPVSGTCRKRIGATPYNTGADIIRAIEAASSCFGNRPVDVVHVFSHGFPSGIPGTTSGSAGLYRDAYAAVERASGGRTVSNIPTSQLSNTVAFVLHGCNMARGDENIARSLYEHLAANLSNPRVYGHYNSGCGSRNNSWRIYSNRHPGGRNVRSNAFYSRSVGCC